MCLNVSSPAGDAVWRGCGTLGQWDLAGGSVLLGHDAYGIEPKFSLVWSVDKT